ncbi:MAG: glucose-6-phosphate isomerase, partial [Clostridiales Family XIII bacterium]|nr:glucose-6-phosphate isomerase [Clostridiales Family XIII bacterium]
MTDALKKNKISITAKLDEKIEAEAAKVSKGLQDAEQKLFSGETPFTGWVNYAGAFDEDELEDIERAAAEIASRSKYVVSVGIGGSYLGARAAVSFLSPEGFGPAKGFPELLFAGCNLSGIYHEELFKKIENDDFSVIVISKSGGTLEPGAAFTALKNILIKRYGEQEAYSRIYAVTDRGKGNLYAEAKKNGYSSFVIPDDIGGRYSVQTPVGLLPLAAAGVPVRELLAGAASYEDVAILEQAKKIAVARAVLEKSKSIVTLNYFEPCLAHFAAWLQQLFGESEGKEGKGVLPSPLAISTDLHSVGQFLQDGKQVFYEINLYLEDNGSDFSFGADGGEYAGRSYAELNRAVYSGMAEAHLAAGIPMFDVSIPDRSAGTFGRLVYLFELICAFTALLMDVNPFDQP